METVRRTDRRVRPRTAAALLAAALAWPAAAPLGQGNFQPIEPDNTIAGTVTHVRDGDTIEVNGIPIRLNGLHAPELDESAGQRAKSFMQTLVAGKQVRCTLTGERSYDREIGRCTLDGVDIAQRLVEAGLGRDCPRFSGGRYRGFERESARSMRLPGYCRPRN